MEGTGEGSIQTLKSRIASDNGGNHASKPEDPMHFRSNYSICLPLFQVQHPTVLEGGDWRSAVIQPSAEDHVAALLVVGCRGTDSPFRPWRSLINILLIRDRSSKFSSVLYIGVQVYKTVVRN